MTSTRDSAIAIVGMSCTFPGARNLGQYWSNILAKVDAVGDPPEDWEVNRYYDPDATSDDKTYCKRGGYLGSLADFDPVRFGVIPGAVDGSEPDHFLALRAAYEAMQDAGYLDRNPYRQRTAVIIGRGTYVNRGNTTAIQHSLVLTSIIDTLRQLHPEYSESEIDSIRKSLKASLPPFHADTAPGLVPNIISGRVANRLDLQGPNYIVDAACASSLVAVDLAVRELQAGRCDMALAGGVHASTPPVILIIFSQLKALSRSGVIRPFSKEADGTLLGEGVGMVVLKRLADAERDNDQIYAVIKSVGVASDGRALGLLAPRIEGEELALQRAYEQAAIDPRSVGLIEAHGTATAVGDAVEIAALNNVFGRREGDYPRCAVGSVKSMISHTMPASGMAGLIKTALALHEKVLPPALLGSEPNPNLDLDESNLYLISETRPWIHGGDAPRRAGVNAFGFGGINAHAVLEEYIGPASALPVACDWDAELFVCTADDHGGLIDELDSLHDRIRNDRPLRLHAAENNLRPWASLRIAVVATSHEDLRKKIAKARQKLEDPRTRQIRDNAGIYFFREPLGLHGKTAFLFPGEGAQYENMYVDLCRHFNTVREWFDLIDAAFERRRRSYLPSEAIFPADQSRPSARLWDMDTGAEAVFCANQAMYSLLTSLGVRPDAVVGHSTGEHSALLAGGILRPPTRDDRIAYVLGVNDVFQDLARKDRIERGVLVAVAGLSPEEIGKRVAAQPDGLYVALDNCPNQVVICGSEESIGEMEKSLEGTAAICQRLAMARAYHTPLFDAFARGLRSFFGSIQFHAPQIETYSCVTASRMPDDPEAVRDLACIQWARTVRFRETVEAMYADGVRVFVECGPRGNLTAFLADTLAGRPHLAAPANLPHRTGILQLQHILAMLVAAHVSVDLAPLYRRRNERVDPDSGGADPRTLLPIRTGLQPARLSGVAPSKPRVPTAPERSLPTDTMLAVPESPVARAMSQYLRTMQATMEQQAQIVQTYLAVRQPASSAVSPRVQGTLPFVTEVLESNDKRVRTRYSFSLERDRLFQDHTFGRNVSKANPSLSGLPVVPLTVTLEILAETASLLFPDMVLKEMGEVRASRWLSLEDDGFAVEVEAQHTGPGSAHVVLRQAGQRAPIWVECDVLFGSSYGHAPPRSLESASPPSKWTAQALYRDGMFHGPAFQAVRAMLGSSARFASASLGVPPRDQLFQAPRRADFLSDAVILDNAGQVVAFWAQETLDRHGDIFPYFLKKLELFSSPAPAGTRFECRIFVREVTSTEIHSDIEIVDATGRLHLRMTDWADRRFFPPRELWDLRVRSGDTDIGREMSGWFPPDSKVSSSFIDWMSSALLESSHEIWMKAVAYIVLSANERREWVQMSGSAPKRRQDWLRGRCAAKDAVRKLLRKSAIEPLPLADIEIRSEESGRPIVQLPPGFLSWTPAVSISHSAEAAIAVAASPELFVGVDMEPAGRSATTFERIAFVDQERALVHSFDEATRDEWMLRLWCAKEALGKAIGHGFQSGIRGLRVREFSAADGNVVLELTDGLEHVGRRLGHPRFVAHTKLVDGMVFSSVLEAKGISE